ncbi:hypothetical protein [Flavobacterium urumqiense]|uniref:O-antigen ligase like membrane protein n=1 Tax=Flavobacterium urumqiense TaxID=935224 RepID=A0A1H5Y3H3_9FLAO|nr:hypothetical protein [Flavobacterium urumqiense]SEG18541.1 hypothetical protein SAMN04488130_10752 [Flavobacterium urumqiense]
MYDSKEKKIRKLLYIIIFILVFEGMVRKILPDFLSVILFFVKDLLCLLGLYYIYNSSLSNLSKRIVKFFMILVHLIFPLLLYNVVLDPVLLIWGAKTYLLYLVVAILMTIAFPPDAKKDFKKFIIFIVVLLVPTVLTAILQINLPASHWLNRAVGGESLEGFSAGGKLRVSSTFSFTAQFSFFLLFVASFYFANLFFEKHKKHYFFDNKLLQICLGFLLITGAFITGGRTAVLGLMLITLIGAILILLKNPGFALKKILIPIILVLFLFPVLKTWKPEYFAAYEERSGGDKNDDVLDRVLAPFTGAIESLSEKKVYEVILGKGLGVMTNGVQNISSYANLMRSDIWTENDFSTIVWEGGVYLIFVWYGFRLFIVFYSFRLWYSIRNNNYSNSAAFLIAYIIITGLTGTLSIQPPLAIYFWITFGAIISLKRFDQYDNFLNRKKIT